MLPDSWAAQNKNVSSHHHDSVGRPGAMSASATGGGAMHASAVSCLTTGALSPGSGAVSSAAVVDASSVAASSSFLLLPRGAGSNGVRQYVTVRVTT